MISLINEKIKLYESKFPLLGMFLFTEANPHIVKILKDIDYWNALEALSGDNIGIFATSLFKGSYAFPPSKPGYLSMMIPVWQEPKENKKILSFFNIENSRELPLFVIFCFEDNEIRLHKISIEEENSDKAFNSIKNTLEIIDSIYGDGNRNSLSKQDAFRKLSNKILFEKASGKFKTLLDIVSTLRGVIGL